MELFGDGCYKHRAVMEFVVADRSSAVDRSTIAHWARTATDNEIGKHSSMFASVRPSCRSLLALRWCKMLIPSVGRIKASQPDNWCSVFQPAKEVLILVEDITLCYIIKYTIYVVKVKHNYLLCL